MSYEWVYTILYITHNSKLITLNLHLTPIGIVYELPLFINYADHEKVS